MDEQSMQFSESVLNRLSKRHLARDVGGDKIFLRFPLGCNDCFLPDWGHKVKIRGFEILYIRSKCLFSKGRCPRPRGGLHMCVRVIICLILQTCHWHFPFAIDLFCQSDNPDSQRKECELHTCLFSAAARCEYHGWRSFCTFVFFFFLAFMNQPFSAWAHTYPVVCAVVCLQGQLRFEKCRYMRKVANKKKKRSAFQECVFKGFSQCLVPSPCGLFAIFNICPSRWNFLGFLLSSFEGSCYHGYCNPRVKYMMVVSTTWSGSTHFSSHGYNNL